MKKKKTAAVLVALMVASSLNQGLVSAKTADRNLANDLEQWKTLQGQDVSQLEKAQEIDEFFQSDVKLVVEFKKDSLLERFNNRTANMPSRQSATFQEFESTTQAQQGRAEIKAEQDTVLDKIADVINDGEPVTVDGQYDVIANVAIINAKGRDILTIRNIPGVKKVSIAQQYEKPKVKYSTENPFEGTGNDFVHASLTEYKGDEMLIAILDTGADTDHVALSGNISSPDNTAKPKYNETQIAEIIEKEDLVAESYETDPCKNAASVYKSQKVPFAYDYCDHDCDVRPTYESITEFGNDHGTHVAGIAAAKSTEIEGIAPNAQLAIMKVFPDENEYAGEQAVLDALTDCVKLGVDTINMSFGSANGYTDDPEDTDTLIFARLTEAGINIIKSAGNNADSAEYNFNGGFNYTWNPDLGITSTGATNPEAMAVASLENTLHYMDCITVSGEAIKYKDAKDDQLQLFSNLSVKYGDNLRFVYVGGFGLDKDYANLDVKNRIAVVNRGTTSFNDKALVAKAHGAIGMIVVDNVEEDILVTMSMDDNILPAIFVQKNAGDIFKNAQDTKIKTGQDFFANPTHDQISAFSSWGCTPDLKLKPDVTGVGGFVYSTLPFNKYGNMQGTSMSAPQIAGVATLVKQYVKKQHPELSKKEQVELVNNLIMSTAAPVMTKGMLPGESVENPSLDAPYSPRLQGAGLVNAVAATSTDVVAYSTVNENHRPVMNLGDDVERKGIFSGTIKLKNYSNEARVFNLSSTVMTEAAEKGYIKHIPTLLAANTSVTFTSANGNSNISVTGSAISVTGSAVTPISVSGSSLTLAAKDEVELTLSIELTEEDKKYIGDTFENGEFVEGFLQLKAETEGAYNLTVPFMGFFGDWTEAPLLDTTYYEDYTSEDYIWASCLSEAEASSIKAYYNRLSGLRGRVTIDGNDGYYSYLGANLWTGNPTFDLNKIAISPNGDGNFDSFYWMYRALRSPKKTSYTITDEEGNELYSFSETGDRKSNLKSGAFSNCYGYLDWAGTGKDNTTVLPNNTKVYFEFVGELDYPDHVHNTKKDRIKLPIVIDTEAPVVVSKKLVGDQLTISVSDNQYVSYVALTDNKTDETTVRALDEAERNKTSEVTFTVDPSVKDYTLELCDYAYNIVTETIDLTALQASTPSYTPSTSAPAVTPTEAPAKPGDKEEKPSHTVTYDAANATTSYIDRATLKNQLANNQNVKIEFKKDGVVEYAWLFDSDNYNPKTPLTKIELGLTTEKADELGFKQAMAINFVEKDQLPLEAKVKLNVKDNFKANQKVYLYIYDEATGKLLCVPNSTYRVDEDGYVTLNVIQGGRYIVTSKAAPSSEKVSVAAQVKVAKKASVKAGSKKTISVKLPATVVKVTDMSKFNKDKNHATYGATITYSVSDKSIATISKSGKLTAKKAGKVTVSVKVTLSNGSTKTYKTSVTVK